MSNFTDTIEAMSELELNFTTFQKLFDVKLTSQITLFQDIPWKQQQQKLIEKSVLIILIILVCIYYTLLYITFYIVCG